MAKRSDIIYQTLELSAIGAPDIVNVFVGCILMFLGAMLVVGFWTRFIALALLILLAISHLLWLPPASQVKPPDLAPSIEAGPQQVAEVIENTIESVPATEVVPEELTCLESDKIEVIFHVEALYGILFFYLFLIGGGQWAISRKRVQPGQSVLESEQSIFSGEARPSIFNGDGDVILTPPVDSEEEISNDEATENSEEEDKGS